MKENIVSAEYIGWLLTTNDLAVERAIVCLYNRQTFDEQVSENTHHRNGRGFSVADVKKGTYMAKWVLAGNHLTGKWLIDARVMSYKYIGQLLEEARIKSKQKEISNQMQADVLSRIDREVAEEKAIIEMEARECLNDH